MPWSWRIECHSWLAFDNLSCPHRPQVFVYCLHIQFLFRKAVYMSSSEYMSVLPASGSPPLTSPFPPRLQMATVSKSSQTEPTMDSDERTDRCGQLCVRGFSDCIYIYVFRVCVCVRTICIWYVYNMSVMCFWVLHYCKLYCLLCAVMCCEL